MVDYSSVIENIANTIFSVVDGLNMSEKEIMRLSKTIFDKYFLDLSALAEKDPAAQSLFEGIKDEKEKKDLSKDYVNYSYISALAVQNYRIANELWYDYNNILSDYIDSEDEELYAYFFKKEARRISDESKKRTGIEIHPAAIIGHSFRLDHGTFTAIDEDVVIGDYPNILNGVILGDLNTITYKNLIGIKGTVIGETTNIGDYCSISSGVILGAPDVCNAKSIKRHPTIGNNVTICADVRILGPVKIGNNVFISPKSVITTDVPDDCRILITNQLQFNLNSENKILVYGIVPDNKILTIFGENLIDIDLSLIDSNNQPIDDISIDIISKENKRIVIGIYLVGEISSQLLKKACLMLRMENDTIIVHESIGLKKYLSNIRSSHE